MTTNVEPAVGDKRSRDEDSYDDANIPPSTRFTPANNTPTPPNNFIMQSNGAVDVAMNGPGINDALYLGDLQWVRIRLNSVACLACCNIHQSLLPVDNR